ncbi:MAG: hypothetical protein ACFFE4_13030 [Candidatus Thorarchaeota archaeon]
MKNKNLRTWFYIVILVNVISFGSLPLAIADDVPKISQTAPMKKVVLDGIINETEWTDRDWTITFFLDVDDVGNPPDKDGTNYLYLGEDLDYFYVGLDLCSDQTDNVTGEWISLWLNIFNRSFDNYEEWSRFLNNGTESLIYDVENVRPWQFFNYSGLINKNVNFNDDNEITTIYGNIEGNYSLLDYAVSDPNVNITSVNVGPDHLVWIDFSIDIRKWFIPGLAGIFISDLQRVKFEISSSVNTSILENKIVIWYPNGSWDESDPNQVFDINNGTTPFAQWFWYEKENVTTDGKIQFSLIANNSAPFKIKIPYFIFDAVNHLIKTPHSSVSYPYSSLINFDIAWGFNTSANNPANHRMFEFRIPKSSLEFFDSDNEIGIIIGGYGTLSFPNSSYWVYSKFLDEITEEQSTNYYYYNMLGIDFPLNGRSGVIHGYNVGLIIGLLGIGSLILYIKKLKTR